MGGSRLPTGFCRGSCDASQASGGTGRRMSMSALRASIRSRTGIVLSETFINALLAFVTYAVIVRITDLATVGLWALVSSLMAFARSVDVWSRGVSAFVAQARRSEEHTSELKSLMRISYAVFCLKKKK